MRLRWATEQDVSSMIAIKQQLQRRLISHRSDQETDCLQEGFLLGSSPEQYHFFIQQAYVLVLETDLNEADHPPKLIGFAIGIPDLTLRQMPLWQKRTQIHWLPPEPSFDLTTERLGYIEQLAILPHKRHRFYAPALALALAKVLFERHTFLFASVVEKPLRNRASEPLLKALGAQPMGHIEEIYPEIDRPIRSTLYGVTQSTYQQQLAKLESLTHRLFRTLSQLTDSSDSRPKAHHTEF